MRILFVTQGYHPQMGGIESQARMLTHALAQRHEVAVAALSLRDDSAATANVHSQGTNGGAETRGVAGFFRTVGGRRWARRSEQLRREAFVPRYPSYQDGDVAVHALTEPWLDRMRLLPTAARVLLRPEDRARRYETARRLYVPRLRRLMRGVDVVHCLTKKYLANAALEAARAEKVPFAITPYVHPGQGGEDRRSIECYRSADLVFALLDTDADHLVELGVARDRIGIQGVTPLLPETMDGDRFRREHGIDGKAAVVLFIGRMAEYKGFPALLQSAPGVWSVLPETTFVFIGPSSGSDPVGTVEDSRVRYLGTVSEQEKADALSACDLFCMPSSKEILPAVYLEAWSCGKPIIGGPAHGLRELIEGNGGGVVEEQDPDRLGRRILELLQDASLRREMGERGRRLVEEQYSSAALVGRLEKKYHELAAQWRDATLVGNPSEGRTV